MEIVLPHFGLKVLFQESLRLFALTPIANGTGLVFFGNDFLANQTLDLGLPKKESNSLGLADDLSLYGGRMCPLGLNKKNFTCENVMVLFHCIEDPLHGRLHLSFNVVVNVNGQVLFQSVQRVF